MKIYIIQLVLIWINYFLCFRTSFGKNKNRKKIFLFLTLSNMFLVLGLRSNNVGEDTGHYVTIFRETVNIGWHEVFTKLRITWRVDGGFQDKIENGFVLIAKTVHLFTDNPQIFLLVVAGLTMFFFGKFIYDNSNSVFLSTYVLLCECIYMSSFNAARQILAVAIGINAYTFLKSKKVKTAIVIIILAGMIHSSAIVYFLLFLIDGIKAKTSIINKRRFKYILFVSALIPCSLPIVEFIFSHTIPRYTAYFVNNYWTVDIGGTMIIWALELFMVMMLYNYHFEQENSFEVSAYVIIYLVLEMISFKISVFGRLAWYYRGFLIAFFPIALDGFREKRTKQLFGIVLILLLTMAFISYARADTRIYSFLLN